MSRELEKLKEEYLNNRGPETGKKQIIEKMEKAMKEKQQQKIVKYRRRALIAAAAVAICIILPNTNASVAMAMEKIPVLGSFFKVVTFRNYEYDDGHNAANVEIPKVELSTNELGQEGKTQVTEGVEQINKSVEEYTDILVQKFEEDMVSTGEGYQRLDVSYEVQKDTDKWFTLIVYAVETKASGAEQRRYYHIDKTTGEVVTLSDLFVADADYVTMISDDIKAQMRELMKKDEGLIYFVDSDTPDFDFKEIKADANFYYNDANELVIVFDEYEAAPGYMGCPEFTISNSLLKDILK